MVNSPHYEGDPSEEWKEDGGRFILKPRGFGIMWGNRNIYWRIPPPNVDGPAHLVNVWSLDVHASKVIDPKKSYQVGFNVSLQYKWGPDPIFIMAKRGANGNLLARRVYLDRCNLNERFDIPSDFVVKFENEDSSEPKLHLHIFDHWSRCGKRGLLIHHAFVKEANDDNDHLN